MSLSAGSNLLQESYKELSIQWRRVETHWNDERKAQFEERYLAGLDSMIRSSQRAMERIAEVLARASRECE